MAALQGSLGHKGQGLSPSSMERDSKAGLFPACSAGYEANSEHRHCPSPLLAVGCSWPGALSGCCALIAVQSLSLPLGFSPHGSTTSWPCPCQHTQSFLWMSGTHLCLVSSAYKVGSLTEARVVLSFSLASSNGQQIFSSSSYVTVDNNSPSGLRVPKLSSSVVLSVSSLLLPKQ